MATPKIRRIDCNEAASTKQLASLKEKFLHGQDDVVSPQSKKLTQAVFGSALPPSKVVEKICLDVKAKGLSAVLKYTEQLDKTVVTAKTLRVSPEEMLQAYQAADPEFLDCIRRLRDNIMQFQIGLLSKDATLPLSEQYELQLRYRALRRVGICVPGGAAAYPSSLLMTVCPAQAADVPEIVVVMPPTPNGANNKDMLAVCHILGVKEVYRVGGAQAVAALAYGVEGLPAVDMIVGPGNIFVSLAKQFVNGSVAIDCIAGPSEVIVVADESAQADFIALDLIAQAEHSPGTALLVTWSEELLSEVDKHIAKQLAVLERGELAKAALEEFGCLILTKDKNEAIEIVNSFACEHLHIQTRDPEGFADKIDNAGAIFIGQFTPVAVGDYAAGPSHVLPTGGSARFASGLSANDFRKRTSIVNFTKTGLREIADDVILMAKKEGLTGHAASVQIRLRETLAARPPKKVVKPAVVVKK
jgi:histidinol dehydrogenase